MIKDVRALYQLTFSVFELDPRCRRGICLRYRRCVPPRLHKGTVVYRCPYDTEEAWERRAAAARMTIERLMKVAETRCEELGIPFPFARTPKPDHFDLTKPLDLAPVLAPPPDDDEDGEEEEGRYCVPTVEELVKAGWWRGG
jgi:hypothetical protein